MKIVTTLLGLTLSGSAFAGAEAGLIAGFDSMSSSEGGGSSSGMMFGARGGTELSDGIVLDAQFLRHSASEEVMGVTATTSQIVVGAGARYYIGDGDLKPFGAGHLNYHLGANLSMSGGGQSASAEVPGTSGLGADVGGGAQFAISDSLYAEGLAYYSLQLSGDFKFNTLAFGAGFGAKF